MHKHLSIHTDTVFARLQDCKIARFCNVFPCIVLTPFEP